MGSLGGWEGGAEGFVDGDEVVEFNAAVGSRDALVDVDQVRAMLDALADGIVTDSETTSRYLHQCRVEVQRMSDLIDDLFDLAQLDVGHIILQGEQVSLPDLVSDTLASFGARAQAKGVTPRGKNASKNCNSLMVVSTDEIE